MESEFKKWFGYGWNAGAGVLGTTVLVLVVIIVLALVGSLWFRMLAVDKVENYEFAYRWDLLDGGKITPITRVDAEGKIVNRTGYVITWPIITKVHTIDGRPMQVCISAIQFIRLYE